jgi:DNA polymerase-3 subunit delta
MEFRYCSRTRQCRSRSWRVREPEDALKIPFRQLKGHLREGPCGAYLVAGEEPLLVEEAAAAVREAAVRAGFDTREVHNVDRGFNWAELAGDADNFSLFASRKVVELRMTTPRPGDAGSKMLAELAERRDPDRVLLITVPEKLDSTAQRAAWVTSIERHGTLVEIWPVDRNDLPGWIEQRAAAHGLTLTSAAAQLLAERVEGNLLAADQEIKRLALNCAGRKIDEAEVLESVADSARFDVFRLADAVLAGDAPRAFKVLAGLQAEGVAPVLVGWALNRDIDLLARLEQATRRGEDLDGVLNRQRVWRRRQPLVKQALRRFPRRRLTALMRQAVAADAAIKGGGELPPWQAVTGLMLGMLKSAERG